MLGFATFAFTSLLAIVNPVGAVPLYIAMTGTYDEQHRRATLRRAIITALVMLVAFSTLGTLIMRFFGITTQAFQIAGGIIFFGIGWEMLQAQRSRVKPEEEAETIAKEDVGIVPLGMPLLAGPGSITTVITLNAQASTVLEHAAIYIAIVLVLGITWATLAGAPAVTRRMGSTGMNVLTRIMGLIVMVIGAQFVINGVTIVLKSTFG
ncbi:MAG: NAAT family transporter [Candidatus Cloacimonetes bacterium]|jgi:multiple antibiotic resistance protein|nr:NAAT family transporter [Candidatus Cloacimonadota bacterium]